MGPRFKTEFIRKTDHMFLFTSPIRFQKGFSLVEVVIALGMAGIVGLGAAFVMQQQVVQQKRVATKMDLNGAHAIALQKARNLEFISDQLGLATNLTNGKASNQQLCLAGNSQATGCSSLPATRVHSYSMINTSTAGNAVSNITSKLVCVSNSCSKIEVLVDTALQTASSPAGGGGSSGQNSGQNSGQSPGQTSPVAQATGSMHDHLSTKLEFPALAFAPIEEIKMVCAGTSSMYAGVNLGARAGLCGQLLREATTCSQALDVAMFTFGSVVKTLPTSKACSNLRSRTCPGTFGEAGVGTIGQGNDPILCRGLASLEPTPAPAPPAPPTPLPTAAPTAVPVPPTPVPPVVVPTPVVPVVPPAATAPPVTPPVPGPVASTCSCANLRIGTRTWSPCGPPGVVVGSECLIDAWLSNTLPAIACTSAFDLGLPDRCTYAPPAAPTCNGVPAPANPVRTCAPGEVRMMCGGDRWLCRSTGWEWSESNICGIPGVTRCP